MLSANGGFDSRITLDKEGPIHSVSWSPNSKEFGVVYGYMPAKATIFNQKAVATHTFPLCPRNTIIFSPTGRFVIVAGFGNLAGQMDIYDLEKDYKKVCTIEGGSPSVCEWSPDGKFILTATTSPRLRVDNGVRLWHVGGGIVYNEDMVELYHVTWRPQALDSFPPNDPLHPVPTPHSSALAYLGTVKTPSKPAGAYRPPGARGTSTPLHFKREDEGGVAHIVSNGSSLVHANSFTKSRRHIPGAETATASGAAEGDEALSKAAVKNKKKREAKKAKEAEAKAAGLSGNAPEGPSSGNERRSPERQPNQRSLSKGRYERRSSSMTRQRSNTQNNGRQNHQGQARPQGRGRQESNLNITPKPLPEARTPEATPDQGVPSPTTTSPNAKKLRGLQKKIRAIEDLEMRLAGGQKLEDTQMKKIGTKGSVQAELEMLERDG